MTQEIIPPSGEQNALPPRTSRRPTRAIIGGAEVITTTRGKQVVYGKIANSLQLENGHLRMTTSNGETYVDGMRVDDVADLLAQRGQIKLDVKEREELGHFTVMVLDLALKFDPTLMERAREDKAPLAFVADNMETFLKRLEQMQLDHQKHQTQISEQNAYQKVLAMFQRIGPNRLLWNGASPELRAQAVEFYRSAVEVAIARHYSTLTTDEVDRAASNAGVWAEARAKASVRLDFAKNSVIADKNKIDGEKEAAGIQKEQTNRLNKVTANAKDDERIREHNKVVQENERKDEEKGAELFRKNVSGLVDLTGGKVDSAVNWVVGDNGIVKRTVDAWFPQVFSVKGLTGTAGLAAGAVGSIALWSTLSESMNWQATMNQETAFVVFTTLAGGILGYKVPDLAEFIWNEKIAPGIDEVKTWPGRAIAWAKRGFK